MKLKGVELLGRDKRSRPGSHPRGLARKPELHPPPRASEWGGHLFSPPLVGNRGPETGRKSPQITQQDRSNLVAQTGLPRAYPELSSAFSRSWRGSGHGSPHYPGNEAPSLPRPTPSLAEEKPGLPHVWGCSVLLVTSSKTQIPWLRSPKTKGVIFIFISAQVLRHQFCLPGIQLSCW